MNIKKIHVCNPNIIKDLFINKNAIPEIKNKLTFYCFSFILIELLLKLMI